MLVRLEEFSNLVATVPLSSVAYLSLTCGLHKTKYRLVLRLITQLKISYPHY